MTQVLITYSLGLLIILFSMYFFVKGFVKKSVSIEEAKSTFYGMVWLSLVITTIISGNLILEKGKTVFNIPKDFYSEIYFEEDSTISDQILFQYMKMMRIPHKEVVLMQAKIESANYSSGIFKRNSNLFGMKVPRSRVTVAEAGRNGYAEYKSWKESVNDYAFWQFTHNVDKLSQEEYLQFLGKIYAEDPNYVTKIRGMVKKYDFENFKEVK